MRLSSIMLYACMILFQGARGVALRSSAPRRANGHALEAHELTPQAYNLIGWKDVTCKHGCTVGCLREQPKPSTRMGAVGSVLRLMGRTRPG